MNLRGRLYLGYVRLRGSGLPAALRAAQAADARVTPDAGPRALAALLRHARDAVPYYGGLLRDLPAPERDPVAVLRRLPVLTKAILRERFEDLKSRDLPARRWRVNTSGGSTGEPARFVQDDAYEAANAALALLSASWVGHELGDPLVRLWGSERDVLEGSAGWRRRLLNALTATTFLNAFRLTPEAMRGFGDVLRRVRPKLVVAYAQAAYELAGFLERERVAVPPVPAVITSAGTLHPFMRERIARVLGARVFDRYGSREAGLIAAERPGVAGLWVPPWGAYLEVVDEAGRPVPPGVEGELLVTSLVNRAMPLVRYRIGDRGVLGPPGPRGEQFLARVLGRNVDAFRRRDGTLVDGEYFTHLVYFRPWVDRFQFVQRSYDEVLLRVQPRPADRRAPEPELAELAAATRAALGPQARLRVEWVSAIPPSASGKFRYTVSELAPAELGGEERAAAARAAGEGRR